MTWFIFSWTSHTATGNTKNAHIPTAQGDRRGADVLALSTSTRLTNTMGNINGKKKVTNKLAWGERMLREGATAVTSPCAL